MKRAIAVVAVLAAVLVAAFLVLRTPDTGPAAMRAKYGGAPSQFVRLDNGMTVHVRDQGARGAPAIVLLHGSNSDLHTWQPWVDALKRDFRVVRFDQRGHGLTGPAADGDYRQAAFVADVNLVADALGLDRFVLGGNSMGGGIALAYALAHPGRLEGLVLVDAAGAPVAAKGGGNIGFAIARTPGINRLMSQITPRAMVEKSLRQSVSNSAVATPAAVDRYWELLRYPGNRAATLARFTADRRPFAAQQVRALDVPTLVMWGDEDRLIPLAAGRWFADTIPNSAFVHYPGIGHLPMEEAPDRSAADLSAWLARLPADGRAAAAGPGGG
ncbi:alpha/beta fold hydrolase [Tsuneonella amylolytica]|uniref:alpha/beta fold hydrolase n=1 Tax=Tsuneonella amylolytica TaxID=2338327 RepID=UPI001F430ACC|nr:alpha/beta hydrolase [Tsuneonella amylolytica]